MILIRRANKIGKGFAYGADLGSDRKDTHYFSNRSVFIRRYTLNG